LKTKTNTFLFFVYNMYSINYLSNKNLILKFKNNNRYINCLNKLLTYNNIHNVEIKMKTIVYICSIVIVVLIIFSSAKKLIPLIGTLHDSCVPFLRTLTISRHDCVVKVLSYFTKEKLNIHNILYVHTFSI